MLIKRIFILFLLLIFIIVLIEGVARLFFRITDKDINVYRYFSYERQAKILMPDSQLGYKLIPNVSRNAFTSDFQVIYKTNSIGLREKEIKDTGGFKILFLGDSMTFGTGVPYGNRFSDLIEKEIKNVYTINAGVPGYGIHQMYLWLKYHGLKLTPDLVICCITPFDLRRAVYKELETAPHLLIKQQESENSFKSKAGQDSREFIARLDGLLMEKSYFYACMKVGAKILSLWASLEERDKKFWDESGQKDREGRPDKITRAEQEKIIREESFRMLLNFKDMLKHTQIKFLAVNISGTPLPWLRDFFLEQNIDYLDLSAQLGKFSGVTFKIDPHYNALGNRIIADLLKEYILRQYKDETVKFRNKSIFY